MKRVVHVVVAGEIGGAERMLVDLASRGARTMAEHSIALMTPNRRLASLFQEAGLRVHDRGAVSETAVAFLMRSLGPRDVAWLRDVLKTERADVAHLHTFGSHVVGARAALKQGIPFVRTEHSTRVYDDPTCWPFSSWSLERATQLVAISDHVRRAALSRAPHAARKLRVVRNGVDCDRFAFAAYPSGERFRFVLVGRLEPRKGVDRAIEALVQVAGAELHIVGEGIESSRLKALAVARSVSDRVYFHGYAPDPRDAVASSHAALCSSRQEGLGIALLESMALGRPVVTVPVGGVPEIVEDGVTGFVSRNSTVEALADAMNAAVHSRNECRERGRRARAFVAEHASVDAMCREYAAVYADC